MDNFKQTGSIIASWDFSKGVDFGVLLIGKREPGKNPEIINAFMGKEAEELMKKLTIQNYGKGPVVG